MSWEWAHYSGVEEVRYPIRGRLWAYRQIVKLSVIRPLRAQPVANSAVDPAVEAQLRNVYARGQSAWLHAKARRLREAE